MLDKDDKYNHLYPALTFTLVGLAAAAGPAARRAASVDNFRGDILLNRNKPQFKAIMG